MWMCVSACVSHVGEAKEELATSDIPATPEFSHVGSFLGQASLSSTLSHLQINNNLPARDPSNIIKC